MKKGFIALVILAGVGLGAYLYITRSLDAPSQNVRDVVNQPSETNESDLSEENAMVEEVLQFEISQAESTVEYRIDETLNGEDVLVIGSTNEVGGNIFVNMENPSLSEVGTIKINARTFATDNSRRDAAVGRMILESEKSDYEFITFEPTSIQGLPSEWAFGEEFDIAIVGDLTVKETTQSVIFEGSAMVSEDQVVANIETVITHGDFGVEVLDLPFLANVGKETKLIARFVAVR